MNEKVIAILLTCHNRKSKTLACLESLFRADQPPGYQFDVYLTDDGSTDGTGGAVALLFPQVIILQGNGSMYWAGGMRFAWSKAIEAKAYDAFLLINDDVRLYSCFLTNLMKTEDYSLRETGSSGIYTGATIDEKTKEVTYGGLRIKTNHLLVKLQLLSPEAFPQKCDITNANILWVSMSIVQKIGIFDKHFTHGIADYDYSLQARKNNIPVLLAPNVCGVCDNEHGNNWMESNLSLKERVLYLKSPKGLAYSEYLYYLRKHFPLFLPYSFIMLWLKTLFPFIWDRFKK